MRRSFVLWLLLLSVATAAPAQPQSRIAFQSLRTGNWDIYVANADGSQVVFTTGVSGYVYLADVPPVDSLPQINE